LDQSDKKIFDVFISNSLTEFFANLKNLLISWGVESFTVWRLNENLSDLEYCVNYSIDMPLTPDDIGFNNENTAVYNRALEFFDDKYLVNLGLLFRYHNINIGFLLIHSEIDSVLKQNIVDLNHYFSKVSYGLFLKEKRTDIYLEYQKKIDFIMQASSILKNLEPDSVINASMYSFMNIFSAEAACTYHSGSFYNIGIKDIDIREHIYVNNKPLFEYLDGIDHNIFIENDIYCENLNVKNILAIKQEFEDITLIFFNLHEDVSGDDEFVSLASSIVGIAFENARNHQKTVDFKLEDAEMRKTVEILDKFVPSEIVVNDTYQLYGASYPAKRAGGDFISAYHSDSKLVFVLEDVCGKGYSAAIITVALSVISEMHKSHLIEKPILEIILKVNKFFLNRQLGGRFVTGFVGVYENDNGVLRYISLGHEPAILLRKGGKVEYLHSEFMPIGIIEENYSMASVKIDSGDKLFVYSDGLTEYRSLAEIVELLMRNSGLSPDETVKKLYADLVNDPEKQKDDFTCIMVNF